MEFIIDKAEVEDFYSFDESDNNESDPSSDYFDYEENNESFYGSFDNKGELRIKLKTM